MSDKKTEYDVVIVGGGIAGIITALELLDSGKKIAILDRDTEARFGGLAKESFGGIFFVNSRQQRKAKISDNIELAKADWYSFAEFDERDEWPKKWADHYIEQCTPRVQDWLTEKGIKFFPVVHWVERGLFVPGNSVPRFHMVWGTGYELVEILLKHLRNHPKSSNCNLLFRHCVNSLITHDEGVEGVTGVDEVTSTDFEIKADQVVIASGGVAGNLERVRANWDSEQGKAPEKLLNGSHRYALGHLHDIAQHIGANVTHSEKLWNYAAGIHHPEPDKDSHGLSVVPPKSALWLNFRGERIGPQPLISAFDTRYIVTRICEQEHAWSWQVLNYKILTKEFAVSGSSYNDAIRNKNLLPFLFSVLKGNKKLADYMIENSVDFVTAGSIEELANKMNKLNGDNLVSKEALKDSIEAYDNMIDRGEKFFNDDQLRRIAQLRQYRGDKMRTSKFKKIDDRNARPLVAIREFILTRKSLGGIQTDLDGQVLSISGSPIRGLYACGEAAGFGGGGMHGKRSLEGTFLGACVLTARNVADAIKKGK
jgi:predicted oxidoreductase